MNGREKCGHHYQHQTDKIGHNSWPDQIVVESMHRDMIAKHLRNEFKTEKKNESKKHNKSSGKPQKAKFN